MLQPLLQRLPGQVPLSVYGIGPGWLYATLAAYTDPPTKQDGDNGSLTF
ncbi:MAG: hypothetical protein J2P37_31465 [Ktedonobacteraceae bacterium]|nr:hypothetical protein [Ktedonobacteraceae bacterium]